MYYRPEKDIKGKLIAIYWWGSLGGRFPRFGRKEHPTHKSYIFLRPGLSTHALINAVVVNLRRRRGSVESRKWVSLIVFIFCSIR